MSGKEFSGNFLTVRQKGKDWQEDIRNSKEAYEAYVLILSDKAFGRPPINKIHGFRLKIPEKFLKSNGR